MPIQQLMLGAGGAAEKTYMDDVFSTYLYKGTGVSSQVRNTGINLTEFGGLVWAKRRNGGHEHGLYDTIRGIGKRLSSNNTAAQETTSNGVQSFSSTGFTHGQDDDIGGNNDTYASWTFRKAPGFFDVKTFTGQSNSFPVVNHDLGCIPGLVIYKKTSGADDWYVWHRDFHVHSHVSVSYTHLRAHET